MERQIILSAVAVVAVAFTYNSCQKAQVRGASDLMMTKITTAGAPSSEKLRRGLCATLTRCHPQISVEACQDKVLAANGFSAPLGLPATLDHFQNLVLAEKDAAIAGNASAVSSCYNEVLSLSCSDPALTSALENMPVLLASPICRQAFAPPTYPAEIVADRPLGYWRLDEAGGLEASDSTGLKTGKHFAGALPGAAGAIQGSSDRAVNYKLSGGHSEFQLNNLNTESGTYFTVEFWMKWNGNAGSAIPVSLGDYALQFNQEAGQFGFTTGQGDNHGTGLAPLTGRWVHVVAVMQNMITPSSLNNNRLYIDGVAQPLNQIGSPHAITAASTLKLSGVPRAMFDGAIDELVVYNHELTPAQAARHYNAGRGKFP